MILAITNDLLVTAPLENAARQAGVLFQSVSPAGIADADLEQPPKFVFLDLTATTKVTETVTGIREKFATTVVIVAFGPHVHAEKLKAARDAGCTHVLTRGQFHTDVAKLVAKLSRS